jgi:GntR family negative regulator for fad regulon and positive regulator of fabA
MMDWNPPQKPASYAENLLVKSILEGRFQAGTSLPAERELALMLGVTRPTLRESLQRLARDGWLEIQQGKPTRVKDYLQEGNLAVLGAIVTHSENLPADFVDNLLFVRLLLAPSYARLAVERAHSQVSKMLNSYTDLEDTPVSFAAADWQLHHQLCILSGNPVFTLILNGFSAFYQVMAERYFAAPEARQVSKSFYLDLLAAAQRADGTAAYTISERVMRLSIELWQRASQI